MFTPAAAVWGETRGVFQLLLSGSLPGGHWAGRTGVGGLCAPGPSLPGGGAGRAGIAREAGAPAAADVGGLGDGSDAGTSQTGGSGPSGGNAAGTLARPRCIQQERLGILVANRLGLNVGVVQGAPVQGLLSL